MAINQDQVGRCDFIDVLEEASLRKSAVAVKLRSGESFIDEVQDVRTHDHEDFVVFRGRGEFQVADIESCTRAQAREGLILDDQPSP